MKKKILGGIAVVAIAITMALNVNFSAKNNNLSDLTLANVEALAQIEIIGDCFMSETCSTDNTYIACCVMIIGGDYFYLFWY